MKKEVIGAICLALAASLWGGVYVVSKYILELVPPMTLLWVRYLIAFVLLYGILLYTIKRSNGILRPIIKMKRNWKLLVWIGFIGYFGSVYLQFLGTKMADAHMGALITSATPAFVIVFAKFVLRESITLRKVLSLITATSGVIIVVGWNQTGGSYFAGTIILVGAAVTWALLSVYVKLASVQYSSLEITTYGILTALIITTPFMLIELRSNEIIFDNALLVPGVLYIAILSTAGGFYLWNKGLELISAGAGSLFLFLQPIVGGFLGWLLLGEKLTSNFYIGGTLIAIGVIIATFAENKVEDTKEFNNGDKNARIYNYPTDN